MSLCAELLSAFVDLPVAWAKETVERPEAIVGLFNELLAESETDQCKDVDPVVTVSSRTVVKKCMDEFSTIFK